MVSQAMRQVGRLYIRSRQSTAQSPSSGPRRAIQDGRSVGSFSKLLYNFCQEFHNGFVFLF